MDENLRIIIDKTKTKHKMNKGRKEGKKKGTR
jgi:hypothetical protein